MCALLADIAENVITHSGQSILVQPCTAWPTAPPPFAFVPSSNFMREGQKGSEYVFQTEEHFSGPLDRKCWDGQIGWPPSNFSAVLYPCSQPIPRSINWYWIQLDYKNHVFYHAANLFGAVAVNNYHRLPWILQVSRSMLINLVSDRIMIRRNNSAEFSSGLHGGINFRFKNWFRQKCRNSHISAEITVFRPK